LLKKENQDYGFDNLEAQSASCNEKKVEDGEVVGNVRDKRKDAKTQD